MPQTIPEIDALESAHQGMQTIRAAIIRLLDAIAEFIRGGGGNISPEDTARLQALVTGFNDESRLLDEATQRNLDVDPGGTGPGPLTKA